MLSRRSFLASTLRGSTLLALAPTVPGFLAQTARAAVPQRDGRILVVIELNGGNDGINTVVPYKDEGYAKHRRLLRLSAGELIKINDQVGLHPAMSGAGKLLESGQLAVVQGVGYPNPNRSHFESMAIWQTACFDAKNRDGTGWIGRGLDEGSAPAGGLPAAVYAGGGELPLALQARRAVASGLTRPEEFVLQLGEARQTLSAEPPADDLAAFVRRSSLDAYTLADRMTEVLKAPAAVGGAFPPSDLAEHLHLIARLIKASIGTRIYYARQSGYDTHAGQIGTHAGLLRELSDALLAFFDELKTAKVAERVVVLAFSEFGRTVRENGSAGTDHGTSGPVFLVGPGVKPGLAGATPRLLDLDPKHGDLKTLVDFRRVYATVLQDWLGLPANKALAGDLERLPLLRS